MKAVQVFANRNTEDVRRKIFSTVVPHPIGEIEGSLYDELRDAGFQVDQEIILGDFEEVSLYLNKISGENYKYIGYFMFAEGLVESDIDYSTIIFNTDKDLFAFLETFSQFFNVPLDTKWNDTVGTYGDRLAQVIKHSLLPLED